MTEPLDRLRDLKLATPGPGQISLAVARHAAPTWPSPEVHAYAQHRAHLIHELVDDSDIKVVSWGETDGAYPREVVEVILETAQIVVPSIATLVAAWLSRPRKGDATAVRQGPKPPRDAQTLLPGIRVKRHDGAELMITYRDGLTNKAIRRMIKEFLDGAVEQ
jgi:hypothetical protein